MQADRKIELTTHVKERRKSGHIPESTLIKLANHLIDQHNIDSKENGHYKFRQGGMCAVLNKTKHKYVFITFHGSTGILLNDIELGNFTCKYQTYDERKQHVEQRELRRGQKSA